MNDTTHFDINAVMAATNLLFFIFLLFTSTTYYTQFYLYTARHTVLI